MDYVEIEYDPIILEPCRVGHSEEMKRQISESLKGREITADHREKISQALTGRVRTQEHRDAISRSRQGQPAHNKGIPHTKETRAKISAANTGKQPRLGAILSDETKQRISESLKNRPKIKCPHCGREGIGPNMQRWHFDNCKNMSTS